MSKTLHRIAIINRGEPARRFIRAVREYNSEHGTTIQTIGLVTPCDTDAPFAREVDIRVALEVPEGKSASAAYLDIEGVLAAVLRADADAVWVGWGFVAEDPNFAERAEQSGLVFLGPLPEAMRLAGDKIEAKKLAARCGVPVVPWSEHAVEKLDEVHAMCKHLGFPVALKAAAGGGGRGIRVVHDDSHLADSYHSARTEAERAFGDGRMFIERCIVRARHLEVQIARDTHGHCLAFGVRDCTVQRRHQKIIEETPGPTITSEQRKTIEEHATRIAEGCNYRGLGTVEFIYDRDADIPYFMEMNARLQVEHPVTELVYGIDLVKLQIDIAQGASIKGIAPVARGHAIEARLNAEDPDNDFAPAPGLVRRFLAPEGPGIRVDAGVTEQSSIPADFDSMIAKVIAYGNSRQEALARLRRALKDMAVIIEGGATNKSLLTLVLGHDDFHSGDYDTGWLDRKRLNGDWDARPYGGEALLAAAIVAYRGEGLSNLANFQAALARGVPQRMPEAWGREFGLELRGLRVKARVHSLAYRLYRVSLNGKPGIEVQLLEDGAGVARLAIGERHLGVLYNSTGQSFYIEVDGIAHRVNRDAGGLVRAPSPALVMDLAVKVGDEVRAGDRLGSLEAMKMEMPLRAPHEGRITRIFVTANCQVAAAQPLLFIEPLSTAGERAVSEQDSTMIDMPSSNDGFLQLFDESGQPVPSVFDHREADVRSAAATAVERELLRVFLGYDIDAERLDLLTNLLDNDALWRHLAHAPDYICLSRALLAFVDTEQLFCTKLLRPKSNEHATSMQMSFYAYARRLQSGEQAAHPEFIAALRLALHHYGVTGLDYSPQLQHAVARLAISKGRDDKRAELKHRLASSLLRSLMGLHAAGANFADCQGLEAALEQMPLLIGNAWPFVADNAHQTRYALFHQLRFERRQKELAADVQQLLHQAATAPYLSEAASNAIGELVRIPQTVIHLLLPATKAADPRTRHMAAEVLLRRLYEQEADVLQHVLVADGNSQGNEASVMVQGRFVRPQGDEQVIGIIAPNADATAALQHLDSINRCDEAPTLVDIVVHPKAQEDSVITTEGIQAAVANLKCRAQIKRICVMVATTSGVLPHWTFVPDGDGFVELAALRNCHPEAQRRLELWRLKEFDLCRIESHERMLIFRGRAHSNPEDERIFVISEVRDVAEGDTGEQNRLSMLPFEHALLESVRALREIQSRRAIRQRYHWNRIDLYVRPVVQVNRKLVVELARHLGAHTTGLGLECLVVRAAIVDPKKPNSTPVDTEIRVSNPTGHKLEVRLSPPQSQPIQPASSYDLKVRKARALKVAYPYEIIRMLTSEPGVLTPQETGFPSGRFSEFDLHDETSGLAVPVKERPYGENKAGIVFGIISHNTEKHPDGLERVIILSDPLRDMGALAQAECARIIAAVDLAESRHLPVEWVPVSSGARISMDSGTENLDWTAKVLRRIIEFTQRGGEINVIVDGVNVGAQSYFNAEATMLMHTRGVLIMTPRGSMVLTGKRALDYSGGVSAEDERGIGGYERIMGPNGQAQYYARDLADAFQILLQHYRFTYIKPGESAVRPHSSRDRAERQPGKTAYIAADDATFSQVGDIFSREHNAERKKPFDMRVVMNSVMDDDGGSLERFSEMRHAETAIVWDCHLGGEAVCLIGFDSRPLPRSGYVPGDGPDTWTGGTLFPLSSKKVARALNAASGNRPAVVLANLSGFDGSPESMRKLQLEYGAEIGRAVVNFKGPLIFCVVARYHGGAYVVFSKALNDNLHSMALEGSYASVIGGAPAAAVVFSRDVRLSAQKDSRVSEAHARVQKAALSDRLRLREEYASIYNDVLAEKQGDVARHFDDVHDVYRACAVGSLDEVIAPAVLRRRLVEIIQFHRQSPAAFQGRNEDRHENKNASKLRAAVEPST